jgi:peptide/nickel transport system permease protein
LSPAPLESEAADVFGATRSLSGKAPRWRPFQGARELWSRFRVHYFSLLGLIGLALITLIVILGPPLYGVDPFEVVSAPFLAPCPEFRLGTDYVGRDVLAGALSGGRASLGVGFCAALFTSALGLSVGALAGFFGGALDSFLMKVTEFFQTLPTLLFAMVLITIFGPALWMEALAIGLASWMNVARLTRAEFFKIKELDYVKSSVSAGAAPLRLIFRTILPNALPPILVAAAFDVSYAILLEGSLSFLGLGDPNQMSWGLIIGQNKNYVLDAWWTVFFPGAAIFLSVLAVCLVSDGLALALNPRIKK